MSAGDVTICGHTHGTHGIKAHAGEGADVHIAKHTRAAGVGMDAADHGQAALGAAQADIRQINAGSLADEHIRNFAVTGDIDCDFPIQKRRIAAEALKQVLRHKNIAVQLHIIEGSQFIQCAFSDSFQVTMNFRHRPSFQAPAGLQPCGCFF